MSDRIKGFTVVLEKDTRDDDFESIMDAVMMIKGVAGVTPSLSDSDDWMNRERVRRELAGKIWDALHEKKS